MLEKTLLQIVTDTERELYQVAGMSVQVYAQDNLSQKVQDAFQFVFDDTTVKWKRFQSQTVYTLDGVTGRTTVPVKTLYKHYEDIDFIYPGTTIRPLAMWNGGNPLSLAGSYPLFYAPDATDVVKIIPANAGGNIVISGRTRPTYPFSINDTVPFDNLTIRYFAAWQYAVDDGSNPAGAEKLRNLFEQRYKQMKLQANKEPIALSGGGGNVPTNWRDE